MPLTDVQKQFLFLRALWFACRHLEADRAKPGRQQRVAGWQARIAYLKERLNDLLPVTTDSEIDSTLTVWIDP